MDDRIEIAPAAQGIIIEKAQISRDAAQAVEDAIDLAMAVLGLERKDGWQIAPDAGAFVRVTADDPEA